MEAMVALLDGLILGVILGLLGGGGSLMAIPVLIYLFHYPFRVAVGSGLVLVTLGVVPALVMYWKMKQVDWLSALVMGGVGMVGASVSSRYSTLIAKEYLLGLLIVLMALSAWNLLKSGEQSEAHSLQEQKPHRWALVIAGLAIGLLTGLVGVGGGFLLVPALLLFGKLSTRQAIATSLVIIGMNALAGSIGYLSLIPFNQPPLLWLIAGSMLGSFLGYHASLKISDRKLRKGFGLLLIALIFLLITVPPL